MGLFLLSAYHASDIDFWHLQRRHPDGHRERHQTVDPTSRLTLGRLAVTSIIERNHGVGDAHAQDRMPAMRELAFEQDLLEVTQGWRHRRHALPKLDKVLLDLLLMKAGAQEPGPQVFHIPTIKANLLDVIALE